MPNISVKIQGLKELQGALEKYPSIAGRNIQDAIQASLAEIQRASVPLTPVDTGRLRRSYRTRTGLLKGTIFPNTEYAIYVHEGTKYMRSRPFLEKGVKKAKPKIENHFADALDKTFKDIKRKVK